MNSLSFSLLLTNIQLSTHQPGGNYVTHLCGDMPHFMILVPDEKILEDTLTHPKEGLPWIMFQDTPYVHVMIPMPHYKPTE